MLVPTALQYVQSLYSFDFDGNWPNRIISPHVSAGMLATHRTALFAPNVILICRIGGRWSKVKQISSNEDKLASIELRSHNHEMIERGGRILDGPNRASSKSFSPRMGLRSIPLPRETVPYVYGNRSSIGTLFSRHLFC